MKKVLSLFATLLLVGQAFSPALAGTTNLDALQLDSNLTVGGNLTVAGTQNITGAVTLSTPLGGASVNNSVKRQVFHFSPNSGGTIADNTTYRAYFAPGRAGTVTKVSIIAGTVPIGGTNAIAIKKAGASGNAMLAASFDPTGLVVDTISAPALTATAADRAITATQGIYVEWAAGSQSTDGANASVSIEFEPADF